MREFRASTKWLGLLMGVVFLACASGEPPVELIKNGDFAAGSQGWRPHGDVRVNNGHATFFPNPDGDTLLEQVVQTVPGKKYLLSLKCSESAPYPYDGWVTLHTLNPPTSEFDVSSCLGSELNGFTQQYVATRRRTRLARTLFIGVWSKA